MIFNKVFANRSPVVSLVLVYITRLGAVHKLCRLRGGGGGQKLPILLSKKKTKTRGSKIADFETT